MSLAKPIYTPSYPIKTIAVAVSFSPYCAIILGEAKYLSDALGATLVLLHIGSKTDKQEQQMNEMLSNLKINYDSSRVIWMEGDEVETILNLCKLNAVDLLVLGARIKENILKFYIGSIARTISRKAQCSVMLITGQASTPHMYDKIIIDGNDDTKTENTIHTALYLAEHLKTNEVIIANEEDSHLSLMSETNALLQNQKTESKNSQTLTNAIIKKYGETQIAFTNKLLKGKQGYAISKFAKTKKANLLVVNAPDTRLNVMDRIFTHDIEYILANLPCNLLIVYQKAQ